MDIVWLFDVGEGQSRGRQAKMQKKNIYENLIDGNLKSGRVGYIEQ